MKVKHEITKFGWKQILKIAITFSLGVGFKWSCDQIEQTYFPKEIVRVGEVVAYYDTIFVAAPPETVMHVPDEVIDHFRNILDAQAAYLTSLPIALRDSVVYIPYVDSVTVFDHVTVIDTIPFHEPPPSNLWRRDPRRP